MSLHERLVNGDLDLAICSLVKPWRNSEKEIKTVEDWAEYIVSNTNPIDSPNKEGLIKMMNCMKHNIIQCPDTFLRQVRQGGFNHVLGETRTDQISMEV